MSAIAVYNDWRLERGLKPIRASHWPLLDSAAPRPLLLEVAGECWAAQSDARKMLDIVCELSPRRPDVHRRLVMGAAACAGWALLFVPEDEQGPAQAVEAAEGWARGEVDAESVSVASRRARGLRWLNDDAATNAAASAHYACDATRNPRVASTAANTAARAAGYHNFATVPYVAGASQAAERAALREMADLVRNAIPWDELARWL